MVLRDTGEGEPRQRLLVPGEVSQKAHPRLLSPRAVPAASNFKNMGGKCEEHWFTLRQSTAVWVRFASCRASVVIMSGQ